MGYIYKITNIMNNKSYIGKTERTIAQRWAEHKKNMKKLSHLPLYAAFIKYGIENFTIEEIEECETNILDEREIYWINFYHTYGEGYNCTGGGEGGIKSYEEHMDEIIERYQKGERLDELCKEFHYDYASFRPKLIEKGITINTNAGPAKLSKKVLAIDPKTQKIIAEYPSISAAARDICEEGKNPRAIGNHIGKYKNTQTISHGYLWKTVESELKK